MRKYCLSVFTLISFCACLDLNAAAINLTTIGATITENFNSLPQTGTGTTNPWTNGTTITGWHALRESGVPDAIEARSGVASQGTLQSLGIAGVNPISDRALGGQNTDGTVTRYYGVQILNNTGSTLTEFNVSYAGEQWRHVSGELQIDKLDFSYQIFTAGGGSLNAASPWTDVNTLDFNAPFQSSTGSAAHDGNDPAFRDVLTDVISNVNWANGDELWLRWADSNVGTTRRAALAIDDFSFTAIPEPSTTALLVASCFLGGLIYTRRKQMQ